jgi:hypothetical protein
MSGDTRANERVLSRRHPASYNRIMRRWLFGGLALAFASGAALDLGAFQRFTKDAADRFNSKLERIVVFGATPPAARAGGSGQVVQFSDAELNAYFRYYAQDQIPTGILEPELTALGEGRVGGRAVVDLDVVRRQKERGWLDPLGYLTGRLPVTATGTLVTKDGVGQFTLESAEVSGVTMPKTLLQELLSYYSRTPEDPDGINMDDPFELPSRIREIRVGRAQATIVQQ